MTDLFIPEPLQEHIMVNPMQRRRSVAVQIGSVTVGGPAPVIVQSMTNTDTADIAATTQQIVELAQVGSELVRITVNNEAAARAVPAIYDRLLQQNVAVPLIGDFHFNGHKLLSLYPDCAAALAKYRINPGNVGRGKKKDEHFSTFIELACRHQKPVRIGVNWGSLDQELVVRLMDDNAKQDQPRDAKEVMQLAMITSALDSAQRAETLGLAHDRIILSVKMSGVQDVIAVYRRLAQLCDYPLHVGLTEAGMGTQGIVASTAALSVLLQEGIGDTIRISLTPEPNGLRTQEVLVAKEILQALGLRSFAPKVVACPGCGRTSSDYFQRLAQEIDAYLRRQMPIWRDRYPGVETMTVAVMGCVVNGPGESKMAHIGISLPGNDEHPVAPVYIDGQRSVTLKGDRIAEEFQAIVEQYVITHYEQACRETPTNLATADNHLGALTLRNQ